MDLLQLLLKASVVVFVVSSMLSIGLAARGGEIVAPAEPTAIVMVIVTGVVGLVLLLAAATWSQRRDGQTGATA